MATGIQDMLDFQAPLLDGLYDRVVWFAVTGDSIPPVRSALCEAYQI